MTSLQNFVKTKGQEIEQSLAQISELQKQLADLQQKLRIEQQLHQAQRTAETEVSKHLTGLGKLFKDLCGIFPPEAINTLVEDIEKMAENVKESYEQYAESGRFLKGEESEEIEAQSALTDASHFPVLVEALPDIEDNTTLLSSSQIEVIINNQGEETHNFLKQQLGISGKIKRPSVLAEKIASLNVTRKRLEQLLEAYNLVRARPVLNGSTSSS
ncbi:MAG: hypothetical protein AAGF26_13475 [Cyanobacteria bacterium P01_G01_bin.49]